MFLFQFQSGFELTDNYYFYLVNESIPKHITVDGWQNNGSDIEMEDIYCGFWIAYGLFLRFPILFIAFDAHNPPVQINNK